MQVTLEINLPFRWIFMTIKSRFILHNALGGWGLRICYTVSFLDQKIIQILWQGWMEINYCKNSFRKKRIWIKPKVGSLSKILLRDIQRINKNRPVNKRWELIKKIKTSTKDHKRQKDISKSNLQHILDHFVYFWIIGRN